MGSVVGERNGAGGGALAVGRNLDLVLLEELLKVSIDGSISPLESCWLIRGRLALRLRLDMYLNLVAGTELDGVNTSGLGGGSSQGRNRQDDGGLHYEE